MSIWIDLFRYLGIWMDLSRNLDDKYLNKDLDKDFIDLGKYLDGFK